MFEVFCLWSLTCGKDILHIYVYLLSRKSGPRWDQRSYTNYDNEFEIVQPWKLRDVPPPTSVSQWVSMGNFAFNGTLGVAIAIPHSVWLLLDMGPFTLIPEKRSSNRYKCSSTKVAQHPDVRCIALTHPFDIGSTETNLGGWCCYDPFLDMDDQVGLSVPGLPSHCFERYQTQKIGTGINGWHKLYDIMKNAIKGKKLEEVGEAEFAQKRSGWPKERKCMEIKMYERTCLRCLLMLFVVPKAYYIDIQFLTTS